MFWAFLTTVLFSISAVTGNRTAKILGGTEANFWRLLFALLLLGTYSHLWGERLAVEQNFPIVRGGRFRRAGFGRRFVLRPNSFSKEQCEQEAGQHQQKQERRQQLTGGMRRIHDFKIFSRD